MTVFVREDFLGWLFNEVSGLDDVRLKDIGLKVLSMSDDELFVGG